MDIKFFMLEINALENKHPKEIIRLSSAWHTSQLLVSYPLKYIPLMEEQWLLKDLANPYLDSPLYRTQIHHVPEVELVLDTETGILIDCNSEALDFFSLSREHLLSKSFLTLSPKQVYGKESDSHIQTHISKTLQGGNPLFEWVLQDSTSREVPCTLRMFRFPPYSQQLIKIVITDLTVQRQFGADTVKNEERLALALLATESACFDWQPLSGKAIWDERMHELFDLDPDSEVDRGEHFFQSIHPDDRGRVQQNATENTDPSNQARTFKEEYRLSLNGKMRHVLMNGLLFRNEKGEVERGIGTCQDISERKRAEEKLRFQAVLLKNVSDALFSTDNEFKITTWNQAAEELYGWRTDEVIGKVLQDLVSPTYPGLSREQVLAEFRMQGSWKGEIITHNKTKEKLHIYASAQVLRDEAGVPIGGIAIHTNITERKQTEIALRDSEEKFSKAFYHNANLMALVDLEHMTLLDVNEAYCQKMEYSREELLHIPGKMGFERANSDTQQYLLEVISTHDRITNFEDLIVSKSGKEFHVLLSSEPISIQGRPLHICTCVDITEQKLAEQQLLDTQKKLLHITERYQLATQSSQVGIWDWDMITNKFVWDNTMYKLYGLEKEEVAITYELWSSLTHPDDLAEAEKKLKEALDGKDAIQSEVRIIWPDTSIRNIRTKVILQRDDAGNPLRMIGTNWDITKEKEIEREKIRASKLELKNKELEQFAYLASHDLKEPIRTVISFASLLKRRYENELDEDANTYINFIHQAANRMNQLVKGLLDYSRIGMNKELVSVDCVSLLQLVLNDLNAQITDTEAQFDISEMPLIQGYATEFRSLFQNLISNAIKFRKPNSPPDIRISAIRKKEQWEFCITDNGIGIDEAYQDKIFVIFQRLHTTDEYNGTGIGLAHCQKIVDLHDGKIWVHSQLGEGSSFYFTIPD